MGFTSVNGRCVSARGLQSKRMKNTTMVRNRMGRRAQALARWVRYALVCALPWLCAGALAQEENTAPEPPAVAAAPAAAAAPSETSADSAENQWVPMGEEELASLSAAPSAEDRAALLASGDTAALEAALDAANARAEQLADAIPVIHRDIREFRRKAMTGSDKAKEIQAKIRALEDELADWAEDRPEIRERRAALESVRDNMMEELRFRREINRKLGRDTFRAVPAHHPILEP